MESEPVALILASQEDVLSHGHVLYGLVKAGKDENCVESTSRMVNVVPRKRIYCMDSVDELIEFRKELLKRPLVLQPIIQAGSGIQRLDCFFCVKKEPWVLMVNQFHQKIMEKISLGMDMAAKSMFRGEPVVLEFAFGDILKKHYYGNISKYMSSKFAYTDCEYGDIIIRSSPNRSFGNKVAQFKFSFEDVTASEIKVRTIEEAAKEKRSPVLEFIPQSQLTDILPNWVFDEVEVEESIVSTSDYHSDSNNGATGGMVVTSQPREYTHSRPKSDSSKHYVSVDLHVQGEMYSNEQESVQDSENDYEIGRIRHFHQGSGRSDSSMADSGFGDIVVHNERAQLHDRKMRTKHKFPHKRNNYDNYAFEDEDFEEPEVDTIITRTGKKTFRSVDKESLSARMMEESYM
ncbi:uncharacterized protein LOC127731002 [Mytilus californianus]|uniref:uncharacterized protein LOC127731002 n=1 Tax=Mytilus californianus TaxID=6549 RepID=UPI002246BE0F|nr:uncharacterized protein LOC127731002 [Mytilus californianus]